MTPTEKLELLLDLIADALIQSDIPELTEKVNQSQKFIRNGKIQQGAGSGVLALFQKDIKANEQDLINTTNVDVDENTSVQQNLQEIANNVDFNSLNIVVTIGVDDSISISLSGGGTAYDGLPITNLLVGDGNPLNISQFVPLDQQKSNVDIDKANEFLDTNNSISYAQDNQDGNIDEEDAFIHRLKRTANDTNSTRTIEDIYNTILPYLTDILEDPFEIQDERPEYTNQSSGYIKFRNLNQGIIIRNTNQEFIEGLDPNNPTYLETGFTITMWVRFLDKVSTGTLFNYGNPTRAENPFGFKLDTFMSEDGQKRHLRLLVYDDTSGFGANPYTNRHWYDSHIGVIVDDLPFPKLLSALNNLEGLEQINLDQYLEVPIDFNEWYFICATYNPNIDERGSEQGIFIPEYWNNHMIDDGSGNPTYQYTSNSGVGNRSKVEIISRTDLLRARGFRV